ncbi:msl2872 [Mesorhizobium japonicum MAFF 303099]|uniref:Msl2872 protein n=1 Tax=Mesorhizobium japonicum (strain LMG 29417 / CECT 9101 / MAFF 303099) TaxID=266835 RepID=Q98HH1_RHILO|nr:msl2872 [Mesorhizobium japonicum MAFF 303099]
MMNSVIDTVAERLGNTRAVCRKCYIHPQVFEAWLQGRLLAEMAEANKRKRPIEGLDDEEALVLRWLKTHQR